MLREVPEASVDGAILRADGANDAPVALLLHPPPFPSSEREDGNLFHIATFGAGPGSIWCVYQALEDVRRSTGIRDVLLVADRARFDAMAPWRRELLTTLLPLWSPPQEGSAKRVLRFRRVCVLGKGKGVPYSAEWRFFELDRAPSPRARALNDAIRGALHLRRVAAEPASVLLLQRLKDRWLLDARTGTAHGLAPPMCRRRLQPRFASFDGRPFSEQVQTMSAATIVVSPHGSQLTNILWMEAGSAVVEVTFNFAYCNDGYSWGSGLTAPGAREAIFRGNAHCQPYYLNFANLAHTLGLTYRYLDPVYLPPQRNPNPIVRNHVYVDANELADLALLLHKEQQLVRQ